jgi:hypothetical protein
MGEEAESAAIHKDEDEDGRMMMRERGYTPYVKCGLRTRIESRTGRGRMIEREMQMSQGGRRFMIYGKLFFSTEPFL